MKNHVLRPLFLAIAFVALILLARTLYVPADFGVNGKNFTFGFHRKGNIDEWKAFPVKYSKGKEVCQECHEEQYEANSSSKHALIQCENCHGPIQGHPETPDKLTIDGSRNLCLRCHTRLPYPSSHRSDLPGIDPEEHNPDTECRECHNVHKPDLEDM